MKRMISLAVAVSLTAAACGGDSSSDTPTTIAAPSPTTTTAPSATTTTMNPAPSPRPPTLEAGTVTCGELEGNFPNGVDDHRMILDRGLVTYYEPSDGTEQTLQFVDDETCNADSEAWRFMIAYLLQPDTLHRYGVLCDFYEQVTLYEPPPANLATVLNQLSDAENLCS